MRGTNLTKLVTTFAYGVCISTSSKSRNVLGVKGVKGQNQIIFKTYFKICLTSRLPIHVRSCGQCIGRPLTLRTNPNAYATFNQIKSFLKISREKTAKWFQCLLSLLNRGGFLQNLANVVKTH